MPSPCIKLQSTICRILLAPLRTSSNTSGWLVQFLELVLLQRQCAQCCVPVKGRISYRTSNIRIPSGEQNVVLGSLWVLMWECDFPRKLKCSEQASDEYGKMYYAVIIEASSAASRERPKGSENLKPGGGFFGGPSLPMAANPLRGTTAQNREAPVSAHVRIFVLFLRAG